MRWVLAVVLLLGVFTEVREPKKGYRCLVVKYEGTYYRAIKFEWSRLTGQVTLTMRGQSDILSEVLGKPPKPGRKIQLSGYEAVTDSNNCTCPYHPRCVDR